MKKIIAFAGSNSSTSINHALVSHVASTIKNCDVTVLTLTDYPLPMYGQDIENKEGFSDAFSDFDKELKQEIDAIKKGLDVTELGTSSFSMLLASHLTLLLFLTKSKAYVSPGCMGASTLGIFGH